MLRSTHISGQAYPQPVLKCLVLCSYVDDDNDDEKMTLVVLMLMMVLMKMMMPGGNPFCG